MNIAKINFLEHYSIFLTKFFFLKNVVTSVIQHSKVSANRQKQEDFNERLITTEIEKTNAIKELVEAQQQRTLVFDRLASAVETLVNSSKK